MHPMMREKNHRQSGATETGENNAARRQLLTTETTDECGLIYRTVSIKCVTLH